MYIWRFFVNNIIGDIMIKIWLVVIMTLLFSGCMIANTPTSKVEDYLGKYQRLDKDISLNYVQLSNDADITDNQIKNYQALIEKQYKSLAYEIKEEMVDGNRATVTAQVKVYDYKEVFEKYDKSNYDLDQYHDLIIDSLKAQKDKVTYTIEFKLTKNNNDEWKLVDLTDEDHEKLLGIN